MIQQVLEKKMLDAIREALAPVAIDISTVPAPAPGAALPSAQSAQSPLITIQIFGAWQPSSVGYIKNQQESEAVATLASSIGTQSRLNYTSGERSYNGTLVLRVRAERDVTGEAILKLSEPIDALLTQWQADTYQSAFTALSVPGFRVCEVAFPGGNPPRMDFAMKTVTIDWPFTLTGTDS